MLAFLVASALVQADVPDDSAFTSWTRFRGPNGSGVMDGAPLPDTLDPDSTARWRVEFPGGFSSPVVWKDRLYLTAEEDGALLTICVQASTGRTAWRRVAPRPRAQKLDGRNHAAAASAAVGPEGVFVFFNDFGLVAYDHFGEELWRAPLGPFNNMYGMGASPVIVDGRVVLVCDQQLDSFIVAWDAATGEEAWRRSRTLATSGHCTPIELPQDSAHGSPETLLLAPGSFQLDAYDPSSGDVAWSAEGLVFEMKSVPVLWGRHVFTNGYGSPMNQPGNQIAIDEFAKVAAERDKDSSGTLSKEEMPPTRASAWFDFVDLDLSGDLTETEWRYMRAALGSQNGLLAFDIDAPRTDSGAPPLSWSYRRSVPQLPSPVAYRDVLYLLNDGGGIVTTFRPDSGEVLFKGRLDNANDTFYASPVAGDGKVYFLSEHGLVVVVRAGDEFEELSHTDLGENVYATPAIDAGRMFVRTTEALYCF